MYGRLIFDARTVMNLAVVTGKTTARQYPLGICPEISS